jgi:hypothetical protein
MSAPIVFPDSEDELEQEACVGVSDERDYSHIGGAIYERPFRACTLRPWPRHTDFRPDELEVRD